MESEGSWKPELRAEEHESSLSQSNQRCTQQAGSEWERPSKSILEVRKFLRTTEQYERIAIPTAEDRCKLRHGRVPNSVHDNVDYRLFNEGVTSYTIVNLIDRYH